MDKLPYLLLGLCLFALVNVPKEWADRWRSSVVSAISPAWQSLDAAMDKPSPDEPSQAIEIASLRAQIEVLQKWMEDEQRLQNRAETIAALLKIKDSNELHSDALRRLQREKQYLAMRSASMPAQVIFRDPSSWSSSLWISVGDADNRTMERTVVAPNSPVIANNALIGVVEFVGESQSRVRLITDAGLVPAVRAMRGGAQTQDLFHHVDDLLTRVRVRADLFASLEEQERFIEILSVFKDRLKNGEEEELAKGEICGCSAPFFRAHGARLKGIGFNYDFSDDAGPARDIRSGRPLGVDSQPGKVLIQPGDLLVTSGLDGIFPAGIPVAIATRIAPLMEGSFTYDLEARPAAGDLMELTVVFVLPPLGSSSQDF
jgi:rod shape-determining protein MreC